MAVPDYTGLPFGENQRINSKVDDVMNDVAAGGNIITGQPAKRSTSGSLRRASTATQQIGASNDPLLQIPPGLLPAPTPQDVRDRVIFNATNPIVRAAAARLGFRERFTTMVNASRGVVEDRRGNPMARAAETVDNFNLDIQAGGGNGDAGA